MVVAEFLGIGGTVVIGDAAVFVTSDGPVFEGVDPVVTCGASHKELAGVTFFISVDDSVAAFGFAVIVAGAGGVVTVDESVLAVVDVVVTDFVGDTRGFLTCAQIDGAVGFADETS